MLSGFQMLIPLHTDGRSNFKVCILCRKLQLTSKIRISLKIGWCLHACFVETQHTFLFYFFLKVVQTHSTPGKKKNQVHINILQETPRLVSHCQNKLNRFMKAIKKNLLPPCLERLFKKINTGKSSVQSVRTYFKRWNRCSEPVNVSVHTCSPFPFFFFFFLNCPVLFQNIHRFKSHSRLKNTTTTTKKEHYCRQQTVNVSGKKLVGSCVSSPVRLGEKLVTSEEKQKKKQLFFQSPRQRDGQTYKDLLWISAAGTRTHQMCEKDFKKKKKKSQKTFLKCLF